MPDGESRPAAGGTPHVRVSQLASRIPVQYDGRKSLFSLFVFLLIEYALRSPDDFL